MPIYAQIENNVVVNVIVADNIEWINGNLEGQWLETAEDGSIRYNYAGIGHTYDPINDAFIGQKPLCGHDEISFNDTTFQWSCDNNDHNRPIFQRLASVEE